MSCLVLGIFLACVLFGFVAMVVLHDLENYRYWHGCYPWQPHEPRVYHNVFAVFDEDGNTRFITDDEQEGNERG
jgi:hypothetical protein